MTPSLLSFQSLIQEHELLDLIAGQLEDCVDVVEPNAPTAMRLKANLSTALADHLGSEDVALYPRLARSADPKLVGAAETFACELAALKVDWSIYLEEWSDDVIESDWATFAHETRAMMARLRARMARENACLYPAALRGSALTLRA